MRRPIIALLAALAAGSASARIVEGELRLTTLPEAAQVVVEVWSGGDLLSETWLPQPTQIPARFVVEAPDDRDLDVRVGLYAKGRLQLLNNRLQIPAGSENVSQPALPLYPFEPMLWQDNYLCGDDYVRLISDGPNAIGAGRGTVVALTQVPVASGVKYENPDNPETFVWTRGDSAAVAIAGTDLPVCDRVLPPVTPPWRAAGNEPFWALAVLGRDAEFTPNIGEATQVVRLEQPRLDGLTRVVGSSGPVIRLTEAVCSDSMSGMPHPYTVEVTTAEVTLAGCGGSPQELLTGKTWRIVEIDGNPIADEVKADITFTNQGQVSGSSGCNRFSGAYTLTGESLTFGNAATSRMACPPPHMDAEQAFFEALARVGYFEIGDDGWLSLLSTEEPIVVAIPDG